MGAPLEILLGYEPMTNQITKWDKTAPGLGVRINTSGTSVYVLKYRFEGKQRLLTLCSTDLLSLDEARSICLQSKLMIKLGEDPLKRIASMLPGQKRAEPLTVRFDKFAELYLERHSRQHNERSYDEERRIRRYLIPKFGQFHLHEITRAMASELHYEIGRKAQVQANRVIELLSVIYGKAKEWEFYPEHLANPAKGIKKYHEKPRDKYVTTAQMAALERGIEAVEDPTKRIFFWMLLRATCRMHEIMYLPWSQVDFDNKTITVIKTKNKRTLVHPLSDQMVELFKELRALHPTSEWCFPSNRTSSHFEDLTGSWNKIIETAGLPELTIHDLRRTSGSWMAQDGMSLHLIAKVLHQTTPHVTARYSQLTKDDARTAMQKYSDKIDSYRKVPKSEK